MNMSKRKCPNCKEFFEIDDSKRYKKTFCKPSCSNKREHTDDTRKSISLAVSKFRIGKPMEQETRDKISSKMQGHSVSKKTRDKISKSLRESLYIRPVGIKIFKKCKSCNKNRKIFTYGTICDECKGNYRTYKERCLFNFTLSDYPDNFDFGLIEKHGWYKAKNKGNNLNGISRDHIISIKYGFENNIDPYIISHPANCQLLKHSDNNKKNTNIGCTLDELLIKIKQWRR